MVHGPTRASPVRPTVVVRSPARDHEEDRRGLVHTALGGEAALEALKDFAASALGPLPPDDGDVGGGPRPVHAVPRAPRPGRQAVPPPLAREAPPPPTLVSPQATNCAW